MKSGKGMRRECGGKLWVKKEKKRVEQRKMGDRQDGGEKRCMDGEKINNKGKTEMKWIWRRREK